MIKGISETEYEIIKNIIKNYPAEFYAYGSRVKGDYTPLSDLDLLVKTDDFDNLSNNIKQDFDRSLLPFVVNLTNYSGIDEKFYSIIEKDLVRL